MTQISHENNPTFPKNDTYLAPGSEEVQISSGLASGQVEGVTGEHWKPVEIDPYNVLPASGLAATPKVVATRRATPSVPYVPGYDRPQRIEPVTDPESVIRGLQKAVESYASPSAPAVVTARTILAELHQGPKGRHDGEYAQRLHDARTVAAHLLSAPVTH